MARGWIGLWIAGLVTVAGLSAAAGPGTTGDAKAPPNHRVVRITPPDAAGPAEVSVAINPTNTDHLVAVSIQRIGKSRRHTTNFAYVSTDGGRSWKSAAVPSNPGRLIQGDDVVAFTADGLAVWGYIAFEGLRQPRPERASNGIFVRTSRDGLAWTHPVTLVEHVHTVTPFEDKPWLRADRSKASPYRGHLYAAWTRFDDYGSTDPDDRSHIYFARSQDGGKSFSVPHRISEKPGDCLDDSHTLMGAVPAVGPKGEVYVVWPGPEGIIFTQSMDGGLTFGKNRVLIDTPGGWNFTVAALPRCNGTPSMDVDVSAGKDAGSIYVCWVDLRCCDPDVFLIASRDGGKTWGEPVRVNDDPPHNGKDQFFAWMAVDPVDGAVNVGFYDRRDCEGTQTGLTLARSVDGGRTFVNHKIAQEPFACDPAVFFGDYLGVDAYGGRVAVAYMHHVGAGNTALSAAVFDFDPGTQMPRAAHSFQSDGSTAPSRG
jgi:hypothetical protein